MTGSGMFESLSIIVRAAEGLGLLALGGVVLALSILMERKTPRAVKRSARTSRAPGRAR